MKAVVYTQYGPPDVLRPKEVEKPVPGENEVLIKIHATTVNRTDCGLLKADPFIARFFTGLLRPRKTILGNEFAGKIEATGREVTSFKEGDRVFGFCGFGGHAEYITMPEDGLLESVPEGMSYEEIAPATEGGHYALNCVRAADIQSGQSVLINGTTGAIGSAAVQLVKHIGAEITAVCNTENIGLVKSLGADRIFDYRKEDFTKDDRVYDVVFDAVGKSSFFRCKHLLKPGGIYLSTDLGYLWQNPFLALWTRQFGSRKVMFPIPEERQEDVVFLKGLIEAGEFRPVIDRQYPLDQIVEAYRYVEKGEKTGNVVITVEHDENA